MNENEVIEVLQNTSTQQTSIVFLVNVIVLGVIFIRNLLKKHNNDIELEKSFREILLKDSNEYKSLLKEEISNQQAIIQSHNIDKLEYKREREELIKRITQLETDNTNNIKAITSLQELVKTNEGQIVSLQDTIYKLEMENMLLEAQVKFLREELDKKNEAINELITNTTGDDINGTN